MLDHARYLHEHLSLQYQNKKSYCRDFIGQQEKVYRVRVANNDDNIEKVLTHLKLSTRWTQYNKYNKKFDVTQLNYDDKNCRLYTSLNRLIINALTAL